MLFFSQCPNFDKIIAVLLADGVESLLDKCPMMPSVPLKPMLAHPTKGIQEVLQRLDGIKFTCEYKYDGERAQVSQTQYFLVLYLKISFILHRFTLPTMVPSASSVETKRTTPANTRTLSAALEA